MRVLAPLRLSDVPLTTMSQYFVRCPHCSYPHGEDLVQCPVTGKMMPERRKRPSSPAPGGEGPPSDIPPSAANIPALGPILPSPTPPPTAPASGPVRPLPGSLGESPLLDPRASSEHLIGAVIDGRYKVSRLLGGGGMAAVFEGEQLTNGRPVAVKVLPFQMVDNRESHKRFFNEARLTAALSNANICSIYDYGTLEDGRPYYVMERLRGQPLSEQIKAQGVLAILDAVEIVMQVLSGLRTAHKRGVIHRDVKPANIFLHERADGRIQVKLLDFGVAKDVGRLMGSSDDTTQLTQTGCVMGTPFYLSPEQILGNRDVDARVDLWAVGVVLYECVSGKRPFVGKNFPELASRIVYDAHRPMWERRPATPELLQQVVDRALAKTPENRYQRASSFLRDLQTVRMALINDER